MEIPSIKVLDRNLKLLDEIDVYTSLDFVRSWQGVGSFNLVVCGHEKSFQNGNIIMLGKDGHKCGIIRTVVIHDKNFSHQIVVSDICHCLINTKGDVLLLVQAGHQDCKVLGGGR